jgi:hypothetical protein
MKKRRTLIISLLLVAALCLGIGYAALSDVLDIQGTAEISAGIAEEAFNQDVYFSAANPGKGATASINTDNNDKATFTATGFTQVGDIVSVTYTIKNESEHYAANVTPKLLQNSNEAYFKITSDWASSMQTINANSEKTITIYVELIKLPTASEGLTSASFNIELTAVTAE